MFFAAFEQCNAKGSLRDVSIPLMAWVLICETTDVVLSQVELTEAQGLADEYAQALGQSRTELSLLKEARAKAQGEAEEAHHMMKGELLPFACCNLCQCIHP
jgi:hypothetical protein